MNINVESMIGQLEIPVLKIIEEGREIAKGIYLPEAVASFKDDNKSAIGYPDTGVFILFKGSRAASAENKYKQYIDINGNTTKEIIFQSRNAAAKFVLGDRGSTDYWK